MSGFPLKLCSYASHCLLSKELREELKTQLAEMTYVKLGEDLAKISEDSQKAQTYLPNLIYVG